MSDYGLATYGTNGVPLLQDERIAVYAGHIEFNGYGTVDLNPYINNVSWFCVTPVGNFDTQHDWNLPMYAAQLQSGNQIMLRTGNGLVARVNVGAY